MKLFAGPSVTSLRSLKVQFGFLLGFKGTAALLKDCEGWGCIYYRRIFRNGEVDPQIGIYRDANNGPCEICMLKEETWEDRVVDETVIYNSKFQIEFQ